MSAHPAGGDESPALPIHQNLRGVIDAAAIRVAAGKAATLVENVRGSWGCEIDPLIAPAEGDRVLEKRAPSAFFGTGLNEMLAAAGVDTVVVTGTSLSGCVRATVVDALSYNYRAIVPRECVADPSAPSMAASMQDIDTKYGDVVGVDEAIAGIVAAAARKPAA